MTNLNVIENKISSVRKYLDILEKYKKYSKKEIEDSIDIKGAVERYLYLAIQATIDLGEALISYKKFRKPSTMGEIFYILNEKEIISKDLTEKMIKMTGFRNIIAHDYGKIDYDILYNVLTKNLSDVEEFLNISSNLN